jgi:hypothetical protein
MVILTCCRILIINFCKLKNIMKKQSIYLLAGIAALVFSSCIKQIDKTFKGATVVEIDATPLNSVASGQTYPILTRIARHGIPVATADSTLRRLNGTVRIRLNLVGPQTGTDQTIGYKIFGSPITSISFPATATGQTPSRAAGTLTVSSGVSGTHFAALSGLCTIPANSSFGYIDVAILDAGATAGQARFLGIQLDSAGSLKPNPNYNKLGLVIDQR